MVLAIASPSYGSSAGFLRRLARLFDHEAAHLRGVEHKDMDRDLLYSLGPTPAWARGARIRHRRRAQDRFRYARGVRM